MATYRFGSRKTSAATGGIVSRVVITGRRVDATRGRVYSAPLVTAVSNHPALYRSRKYAFCILKNAQVSPLIRGAEIEPRAAFPIFEPVDMTDFFSYIARTRGGGGGVLLAVREGDPPTQ